METIWAEALNFFVTTNFPATDKGPMGHLIRLQDMLKATQLRFMATGNVIESSLNIAKIVIPKEMEMMLLQDTLMLVGLIKID